MKRTSPLTRRTPLRSKSATPRRRGNTCAVRRCNRPPARGIAICLTHCKAEADRLFSLIVRVGGRCVVQASAECALRGGNTTSLQCSHLVARRGYLATRWDFVNAECACAACHVWLHAHELEAQERARLLLGDEIYEGIRRKALDGARDGVKPDYASLVPCLRARWAALQQDQEEAS